MSNLCTQPDFTAEGEPIMPAAKSAATEMVPAPPQQLQEIFHHITPTSMFIPPAYTLEQWSELAPGFNELRQWEGRRGIHWALGDWLRAGEQRGQEYTQFIQNTGYDMGTLEQDLSVAKAFSDKLGNPQGRHEKLSFTHHAIVRFVGKAEREKWLKRCEAEDLSTAQLRRMMTEAGDIRPAAKRERGVPQAAPEESRADERVGSTALSPERIGELLTTIKKSVELADNGAQRFLMRAAHSYSFLQKEELPYDAAEVLLDAANGLRTTLKDLCDDLDLLLSSRAAEEPPKRRGRKKAA